MTPPATEVPWRPYYVQEENALTSKNRDRQDRLRRLLQAYGTEVEADAVWFDVVVIVTDAVLGSVAVT